MIRHRARCPTGSRSNSSGLATAWPWSGSLSAAHPLTARVEQVSRAYNDARREFMKMIATTMADSVLIADLDGPLEVVRPGTKH
jgi:hypothetical protein